MSATPYHDHLDVCVQCAEHPFDLCAVGAKALRDEAASIHVYSCPGGCPPGECDTLGPGEEGTSPCTACDGAGLIDGAFCSRCKGEGTGSCWSSVTCSKCGQSAMARAMWEGP